MAWKRKAVRAVLLDPEGRLFLQQGDDPFDRSTPPYWFLPGGGIDHGEDPVEALRRELWEECGFRDVAIGEPLWTQRAQFRFAGIDFDQDEVILAARLHEAQEPRPVALEALEAAAFKDARWWPLEELATSGETVYPADLQDRLREVGLLDAAGGP